MPVEPEASEQFRIRFKHALAGCLGKGFLLEECFGLIWEETLEEISLSDKEQRTMYKELLDWVKTDTSNALRVRRSART